MILAVVVMLSNNAFAGTLNNQTLYEAVKQTSGSEKNSQINVGGDSPTAVGVNPGTIYVANAGSDTISVISEEDYTKVVEDIAVGDYPSAIAIDEFSNIVYVANAGSDTISVISGGNNTKIKDIPVGDRPSAIDVHESSEEASATVYVANADSDTISVIDGENYTKIVEDIPVGDSPSAVGVNPRTGTIYVANLHSDTISVISEEGYTKVVEDILVGGPLDAIAIDEYSNKVYVANVANDNYYTIAVISGENYTNIQYYIPVDGPSAIGYDWLSDIVYIANWWSNTISVIDGENYTKIVEDIPVGDSPSAVGVNQETSTVYVANEGSDGISVIDSIANKVVAGVTFQVNPFNSGYIVCKSSSDDLTTPSPLGQHTFVYSGDKCTAKPNEGFEFSSWEENLEGNATRLISISRSSTPLDSFLEFLNIKSHDKPEATLNITKFGTFTANFKELPPSVPPEFWLQTYVVVGTVIAGLSIPSIIGWIRAKRDARKLNYYHKQISSLYGDGKLDENDIESLNRLRSNILDAYSKGRINEKHYESLRGEISTLYEEIFRKKIDSLNYNNSAIKKPRQEQLAQIKNEVEYAYSKGKINDKHYDLLNKDILNLESKGKADKY